MSPAPASGLSAASLISLAAPARRAFLASLTDEEAALLWHDWRFWARPEQLPPPGDWSVWVLLAGRGFGKTRAGAEWLIAQHLHHRRRMTAAVGPTANDVRAVMIEGESGVLRIAPPWFRPAFRPALGKLLWPNGTETRLFSAAEPERLRGPNLEAAWCDELAAWGPLEEAWDNLELALRAAADPRIVATTTPKPRARLKAILADAATMVSRGSTYDNAANLAGKFLSRIERRYGRSRTGRQEIFAELLEEAEGALWKRAWIEAGRVARAPALARVAVAVDPAGAAGEGNDETGIVVGGVGEDGAGYVLADLSGRYTPDGWARAAIAAFVRHRADVIVAERNTGGAMVAATLKSAARAMCAEGALPSPELSLRTVFASRGKAARAEPVSALYEQGRVRHAGSFPALEDQLCTFEPGAGRTSPDRLDALVWLIAELMLSTRGPAGWRAADIQTGAARAAAEAPW
ncbi:MAG: DNA-packaging protein [Proteobacteria bacterium]|nr:DNA-packaging protein [Pseudomonadota bacterium]